MKRLSLTAFAAYVILCFFTVEFIVASVSPQPAHARKRRRKRRRKQQKITATKGVTKESTDSNKGLISYRLSAKSGPFTINLAQDGQTQINLPIECRHLVLADTEKFSHTGRGDVLSVIPVNATRLAKIGDSTTLTMSCDNDYSLVFVLSVTPKSEAHFVVNVSLDKMENRRIAAAVVDTKNEIQSEFEKKLIAERERVLKEEDARFVQRLSAGIRLSNRRHRTRDDFVVAELKQWVNLVDGAVATIEFKNLTDTEVTLIGARAGRAKNESEMNVPPRTERSRFGHGVLVEPESTRRLSVVFDEAIDGDVLFFEVDTSAGVITFERIELL